MSDAFMEDLLALHALGALEPSEAAQVEAYLRDHPEAQVRFAALLEGAAVLARAVPDAEPPAGARSKVLEAVRASGATPKPRPSSNVQRETPVAAVPSPRPFAPRPRILEAALALAAAAAIAGLVVLNVQTAGRLTALEVAQRDTQALLAAGDTRAVVLTVPGSQTAVGRAYAARDGRVLLAYDLGALDAGRTWQAWYILRGEQTPRSLGVTRAATFSAQLPANVAAVAVSEEPLGGSAQPTTVRAIATL
jgi:anti-sigma factor RsiW